MTLSSFPANRHNAWGVVLSSCLCAVLCGPAQADFDFNGAGDGTSWEDVANWLDSGSPAAAIPAASDNVTITGGNVNIELDADSWSFLVSNSLLTGGSTGEYRIRQLRVGQFGAATLNVDIGDGNIWRMTNASLSYIGSQNGSNGVMNILSGDIRNEASSLRIGEKAGSTGLLSISGGTDTRFIAARETGGVSMVVGSADGSAGTFQIDSGKFRSRAGVTVGPSGLFRVLGSSVTEVEVGSEGSVDGIWTQSGGGVLEFGIDAGGVTRINVADKGGAGTFATFESGALLDLNFLSSPTSGTWTLMEVQNGAITDNGLALAPGVAAGWSFNVDNSGANGLLTATYVIPEPTTLLLAGAGVLALVVRRRG